MRVHARWLVRLGALLGAVSFYVPRIEIPASGPQVFSPWTWALHVLEKFDPEVFVYQTLLALAPVLGSLLVGVATLRKAGPSPSLRWLLTGFFLVWAFTLSTLGSIAATAPGDAEDSGSAALLLFAGPLVLATIVLGRVIGGSGEAATGTIVRASLGALLLIQTIHSMSVAQSRVHAGVIVPLADGALLAAGSAIELAGPAPAAPAAPVGQPS